MKYYSVVDIKISQNYSKMNNLIQVRNKNLFLDTDKTLQTTSKHED